MQIYRKLRKILLVVSAITMGSSTRHLAWHQRVRSNCPPPDLLSHIVSCIIRQRCWEAEETASHGPYIPPWPPPRGRPSHITSMVPILESPNSGDPKSIGSRLMILTFIFAHAVADCAKFRFPPPGIISVLHSSSTLVDITTILVSLCAGLVQQCFPRANYSQQQLKHGASTVSPLWPPRLSHQHKTDSRHGVAITWRSTDMPSAHQGQTIPIMPQRTGTSPATPSPLSTGKKKILATKSKPVRNPVNAPPHNHGTGNAKKSNNWLSVAGLNSSSSDNDDLSEISSQPDHGSTLLPVTTDLEEVHELSDPLLTTYSRSAHLIQHRRPWELIFLRLSQHLP